MSVFPTVVSAARLGVLGVVASVAGFGVSVQAHHVPGDDHTGVILSADPAAHSHSSPRGVRAMYPTREEAEAAAPQFGCEGAHQMGEQWMPCASHDQGGKHGH